MFDHAKFIGHLFDPSEIFYFNKILLKFNNIEKPVILFWRKLAFSNLVNKRSVQRNFKNIRPKIKGPDLYYNFCCFYYTLLLN
jgi:hypothetical protein